MKSYTLKIVGREEGPCSETQVAQMFADGRVNRDTPCKLTEGAAWKTVDDYLPMLKYGTQLPPPTPVPAPTVSVTPGLPPALPSQRVAIVDFDIPFGSVLKIMFKWIGAAFIVMCCFLPAIVIVWVIVMAILAAVIGGAISNAHP